MFPSRSDALFSIGLKMLGSDKKTVNTKMINAARICMVVL